MRYSSLFGKTSKTAPADADSTNAKLLTQGGFVSQQMAGVYSYLPLGLKVLANIQHVVRSELNAIGGQELLMPALTSQENYVTTGRETMDVLFNLEGAGGSKLVLNPTHEEVVTPLVQRYAFSYHDLPLAVYQFQNKFRNEARAKSGILRGREFLMKDMYSFHQDTAGLEKYYQDVEAAYHKIFARLGLGERTVLAYASGGDFSRYSHEFQTIADVGEDTIHLCGKCRIGINKEIFDEMTACPKCGNQELEEKKAVEVGNIFKLHQRFTSAFGFAVTDNEGKPQTVEMGCYGIGISRLMGVLVEVFHDDKGIIWPETVAPYRVQLVQLGAEEEVAKAAHDVYTELHKHNVEVLWDDRTSATAGEKFADADLIGTPYRVVVSKKTIKEGKIEVKKRTEEKGQLVSMGEFLTSLNTKN